MVEEYQIEIKENKDQENFPPEVLIIPIMNSPIFPGMIAPIILSEEKFTQELDNHLMKAGFVALNLVKLIILKVRVRHHLRMMILMKKT